MEEHASLKRRLRKNKNKNVARKEFLNETGMDEFGLILLEYSDVDESELDETNFVKEPPKKTRKTNINGGKNKPKRPSLNHESNNEVLNAISNNKIMVKSWNNLMTFFSF